LLKEVWRFSIKSESPGVAQLGFVSLDQEPSIPDLARAIELLKQVDRILIQRQPRSFESQFGEDFGLALSYSKHVANAGVLKVLLL
jgi:hypothetical protein